jgi:hypothetical protein
LARLLFLVGWYGAVSLARLMARLLPWWVGWLLVLTMSRVEEGALSRQDDTVQDVVLMMMMMAEDEEEGYSRWRLGNRLAGCGQRLKGAEEGDDDEMGAAWSWRSRWVFPDQISGFVGVDRLKIFQFGQCVGLSRACQIGVGRAWQRVLGV